MGTVTDMPIAIKVEKLSRATTHSNPAAIRLHATSGRPYSIGQAN
jgi:hypothetical protein